MAYPNWFSAPSWAKYLIQKPGALWEWTQTNPTYTRYLNNDHLTVTCRHDLPFIYIEKRPSRVDLFSGHFSGTRKKLIQEAWNSWHQHQRNLTKEFVRHEQLAKAKTTLTKFEQQALDKRIAELNAQMKQWGR